MTRWLLAAAATLLAVVAVLPAGQDTPAAETPGDVTTLRNPVPATGESIKQGREIYLRYCADCHGLDGRAMAVTIADATDLTDPDVWRNGTTEGEIFTSIWRGAGLNMPPFSIQFEEETDAWHLVNYIRNLWPEEERTARSTRRGDREAQ